MFLRASLLVLFVASSAWAQSTSELVCSHVIPQSGKAIGELGQPSLVMMNVNMKSNPVGSAIQSYLPADSRLIWLKEGSFKGGSWNKDTLRLSAGSDWVRDYLPHLVQTPTGEFQLVSFAYASAATYAYEQKHQQVSLMPNSQPIDEQLAQVLGMELVRSPLVLQGGNLLVDEEGTVFLTHRTLIDNWNHFDAEGVVQELKRVLFAKDVVWLPNLPEEATGHIDMYAAYLGNRHFVLQKTVGLRNKSVDDAAEILQNRGYQVSFIYSPQWNWHYVNALRVEQTIFMPVYEAHSKYRFPFSWELELGENDRAAARVFESLGFQVVPVPATSLQDACGAVHCLTKSYQRVPGPESGRKAL